MGTDAYRKNWGPIIEAAYRRRGWTQQELADRAGVSERTVGNVIKGHTNPHPGKLAALLRALDLPDDRDAAERSLNRTRAGVEEYREFWLRILASEHRDDVVGLLGVLRDVVAQLPEEAQMRIYVSAVPALSPAVEPSARSERHTA